MKAEEIKNNAQFLCEVCKDNGVYNYNDLEVHHIVKLRDDPKMLLDNSNLIVLCTKHHKEADKGLISEAYLKELVRQREEKENKS